VGKTINSQPEKEKSPTGTQNHQQRIFQSSFPYLGLGCYPTKDEL